MNDRFFDTLPDAARIWINAADRNLSLEEQDRTTKAVQAFVEDWSSHGRRVEGRVNIVAGRFIVIAAHVPGGDVSGCGIDASVHALSDIADAVGFGWAPVLDVFYRDGDVVRQADRPTFSELASRGDVTPDTLVYDTSLTTLADWRSKGFELPARNAWHGRVFRLAAEAV